MTVGGIVASLRPMVTKRGDQMAFCELDDITDSAEIVVFASTWETCRSVLLPDAIVLVKARADRRSESEVKLIALEVAPFEAVDDQGIVKLRIDARAALASVVDELRHLIGEYPGDAPVELEIQTSDGPKVLRFGAGYRVRPDGDFMAEARALLGEAVARVNVRVRARPYNPDFVNLTQLDLDLDVFQGPFDLLLALVMREEIELAEVPIAEIVVAYIERAYDDGELDLESASEFLVLIAALLEIKVRMLFPGEEDDEGDGMTAEQAEAELLARLIEYKRYAAAAAWLAAAGASERRVFRLGPAPLAPRPEPVVEEFSEDPWQLQAALGRLLQAPPEIDLSAVRRRLVPGERVPGPVPRGPARAAGVRLRRGGRRARPAVARGGVPGDPRDVEAGRGAGRAGRGVRADPDRPARPGAGRVGARHRMSELTHTVEALLFVASEPLSVAEIATLAEAPPARVERALDALRDHYCEERSGVVLERVAGGYGFRASRETAAACARLVNRPSSRALSQAAPRDAGDRRLPRPGLAARGRPHPRRRGRLGRRRPARARPDRGVRAAARRRASPCSTRRRCCSSGCSGSRRGSRACRRSASSTCPRPTTRPCGRGCTSSPTRVPVRVNRYLASTGLGSRRAVEELIRAGRVTVNGERGGPRDAVADGDDVRVDGEPVRARGDRRGRPQQAARASSRPPTTRRAARR